MLKYAAACCGGEHELHVWTGDQHDLRLNESLYIVARVCGHFVVEPPAFSFRVNLTRLAVMPIADQRQKV